VKKYGAQIYRLIADASPRSDERRGWATGVARV